MFHVCSDIINQCGPVLSFAYKGKTAFDGIGRRGGRGHEGGSGMTQSLSHL